MSKGRRWVKMFKPQFAELVRQGRKLQTVRPAPKGVWPLKGDVIDCRMWSGAPYRSKQVPLREGVLVSVKCVCVWSGGIRCYARMEVGGDGSIVFVWDDLTAREVDEFAWADGFEGWPEMREWFEREHGLPFVGMLLCWR